MTVQDIQEKDKGKQRGERGERQVPIRKGQ